MAILNTLLLLPRYLSIGMSWGVCVLGRVPIDSDPARIRRLMVQAGRRETNERDGEARRFDSIRFTRVVVPEGQTRGYARPAPQVLKNTATEKRYFRYVAATRPCIRGIAVLVRSDATKHAVHPRRITPLHWYRGVSSPLAGLQLRAVALSRFALYVARGARGRSRRHCKTLIITQLMVLRT